MLLALNSLCHLLVDGLCASTLFGPLGKEEDFGLLVIFYNTLAFSTQCLAGLAADRLRRHSLGLGVSALLLIAGWALPLAPMFRVCLVGLGNSLFHVSGGAVTLERSGNKAGPLGIFVAPGAIGLALGTAFPGMGAFFAVTLAFGTAASIFTASRSPSPSHETGSPVKDADSGLIIGLLLTLAVAVRAVGGSAVSFPWKTGTAMALATAFFVFAGKTAGGFVCDRLGPKRTALLSVLPAALLVAFCWRWMLPSLLGQFALNLTMPVTLWLLYRAMPDAPGLAFGLAASALWPGTIAGSLMTLTGPMLWLCVLVSFLFGLWAILASGKKLQ